MKVKLLVSRAGADGAYGPGDIVEVSTGEASRMIEAGQATPLRAEPVKKASRVERAVADNDNTAETRG